MPARWPRPRGTTRAPARRDPRRRSGQAVARRTAASPPAPGPGDRPLSPDASRCRRAHVLDPPGRPLPVIVACGRGRFRNRLADRVDRCELPDKAAIRSVAAGSTSRDDLTPMSGDTMRYRIPTVLAAAAGAVALAAAPAAAAPTWTVTPGAHTVPSDARLNAVSARTGQDAWAVGIYKGPNEHDGGVMLAERWNGSVWTQTPTPNVQFFDENLLAVSAASVSDVWATGSTNQTGFKSTNPITAHFDGTTWTIVSTPATTGGSRSILDGVVNFGGGNVWAVGRGRNAHALIEHFTPNGWTIVPSPDPVVKSGSSFASSTLTGISAISPS